MSTAQSGTIRCRSPFFNTLESEAKIFYSRNAHGQAREDLVEKQAAERGWMPFIPDGPLTSVTLPRTGTGCMHS